MEVGEEKYSGSGHEQKAEALTNLPLGEMMPARN